MANFTCVICGNVFGSHFDLDAHIQTAVRLTFLIDRFSITPAQPSHLETLDGYLDLFFEFCDPKTPQKTVEEDLPYKLMITRRKLFNETHEAYKADFYLHMAQNCVEVVLLLIGRDKKTSTSMYFDNSKLNTILHRQHGIMRNTKTHHDTLSSYVIDRLTQDKRTKSLVFQLTSKDPKDLSPFLQKPPAGVISAGDALKDLLTTPPK